jgi:hypothetical protein
MTVFPLSESLELLEPFRAEGIPPSKLQLVPTGLISSTNELTENHPTAPRGRVIFPFKYSFRKQFVTLLFGGDERWLDE